MPQMDYFLLSPNQERLLQTVLPKLDLMGVIDRFYQEFTARPETASFFEGKNIADLKKAQLAHWQSLLDMDTREQTFGKSAHIGEVHERINLTPDLYLSGYTLVFSELLDQTISALPAFSGRSARRDAVAAISKLLMADITISLSTYVDKTEETNAHSAQNEVADRIIDTAVDASMSMNHLFVDSLKIVQIASDVDGRVNSISAAIEEMSATVGTITENTQQALDYTQKTSESAAEGRKVSDQAQENMKTIHHAVENTTNKANLLSQSSEQIKGIVTQIQDIAEQTNLLALNATIEAARAGEAGKGFAVVANEVKSLANQTSKATQEISDIVGSFVHSIQDIVSSMGQVSESVETGQHVTEEVKTRMHEIEGHAQQMSARMHDISNALREQSLASGEVSEASVQILENSRKNREMSEHNAELSRSSSEKVTELINLTSSVVDQTSQVVIKLAKSDHIIWKRKLSDMLLGKAGLDESELKDHTQCRLGKWYYSLGQENFQEAEAFKQLEEPHKQIHKLGREAYELFNNKEFEEALKRLDQMEEVSETVITLLNSLDDIAADKAKTKVA